MNIICRLKGHDWDSFDVIGRGEDAEESTPYCRRCYNDILGYRISDDEIKVAIRQSRGPSVAE